MQLYIYSNLGHRGYTYQSTMPDFFEDIRRTNVLSHLVTYDVQGDHGVFSAGEPHSLWGVTTDLDIQGEPSRLYLQSSGPDSYRTGFFAQGYVSEAGEEGLYGARFLELLRLQFLDLAQASQVADDTANGMALMRSRCETLPKIALEPACMEPGLLRSVLWRLLRGGRVALRIDRQGMEAERRSREVLLAVYRCLPQALRRRCGFVTGCTTAQILEPAPEKKLPAVIDLVLLDANEDVSVLEGDPTWTLFDMQGQAGSLPQADHGEYEPLLQFLTTTEQPVLERWFEQAARSLEKRNNTRIEDYAMLQALIGGDWTPDEETIRKTALHLNDPLQDESIREALLECARAGLTPAHMAGYLKAALNGPDGLATLGVRDAQVQNAANDYRNFGQVRDPNGYFGYTMFETLLAQNPDGAAWKERIAADVGEACLKQMIAQLPCVEELRERRVTGAILNQLALTALPFGGASGVRLADAICARVREAWDRFCDQLAQEYAQEKARQHAAGMACIGAFLRDILHEPAALFRELLAQLRTVGHLAPELLAQREEPGETAAAPTSWNGAVNARVRKVTGGALPVSAERCGPWAEALRQLLQAMTDSECPPDERTQEQLAALDVQLRLMAGGVPETAPLAERLRYVAAMEMIRRQWSGESLPEQLLQAGLAEIRSRSFTSEAVTAVQTELLTLTAPCRAELLEKSLALRTLCSEAPGGVSPELLTRHLDAVRTVSGREDMTFLFVPAGRELKEDWLRGLLSNLADGVFTEKLWDAGDDFIAWIVTWYAQNTAVMRQLTATCPPRRVEALLALLARQPRLAAEELLRILYVAGVSAELLQSSTAGASEVWQTAVQALLTEGEWPAFHYRPRDAKTLPLSRWWQRSAPVATVAVLVLALLAGLAVPALLFVRYDRALNIAAGVLTLLLSAAAAGTALLADVTERMRRALLTTALALLPGVLGGVLWLVLTLWL